MCQKSLKIGLIMKLLITTLTMIFISFGANAKEIVYKCGFDNKVFYKVENPLIGKRKIFHRKEGAWKRVCTLDGAIINFDSFKCMFKKTSKYKYAIFDEVMNQYIVHTKNGNKIVYPCTIEEK
jgi:hypothetical protein